MQVINPKRARVHTIREKIRSLTSIDLSTCENVRNRNLAVLAASDLKLTSITVGHAATLAYGKPRITNSVSCQPPRLLCMKLLTHSREDEIADVANWSELVAGPGKLGKDSNLAASEHVRLQCHHQQRHASPLSADNP